MTSIYELLIIALMDEVDVKTIRAALSLTQAQLGERVGVDQSTVSNWENGMHPRGPARKLLESLVTTTPEPSAAS